VYGQISCTVLRFVWIDGGKTQELSVGQSVLYVVAKI